MIGGKYKCAVVSRLGVSYFLRLPTEDADDAKERIKRKGCMFVRWTRADEPRPEILNRLYPYNG